MYNDTIDNARKHIASKHPSLHLAPKHQSLKPKELISISTSTSMSTNNIHAFIKNGNDVVIERVHALVARLVINREAPLSLATDVNLNEVIQAASYLKPGSYIPMTPGKINRALISMFSKFTVCVQALIVKARAMYMPAGYDELTDEYAGSSCGWLVVCHDGWDSIISSSSASQCIGSTCSRGSGTN
jgi:TusA-related sulfurtransferase